MKKITETTKTQRIKALAKTGFLIVEKKEERMICDETEKVCYSKREAGEIINGCKRHRGSDHLGRNKNLPKRSYFCRSCGCFHLTHEPFLKNENLQRKWKFYLSEK